MDNLGVSTFLRQRSDGFLNLIPAVAGILVFTTIACKRPDFTLLTKIFFVKNPHLYSVIMALNAYLSFELVKTVVDFSATTLNVLIGVWATDFFSKGQTWIITERVLNNAKLTAKITILAAVQSSDEAQRHLRVHKRLLKPLESYFNPSEVENMDLIPGEFSHSDMILLNDRINEFDEFSYLKGSVPVQTLLFLLACKELNPNFDQTLPNESSASAVNETLNKKLKFYKRMFKFLAYRSPTLRPFAKAARIVSPSFIFVKFAKTSHENKMVDKQNLNMAHLERCFQSKNIIT